MLKSVHITHERHFINFNGLPCTVHQLGHIKETDQYNIGAILNTMMSLVYGMKWCNV